MESALETLNKVRHWLISAARLLLVVACLLRLALPADEETVCEAGLLVLSALEVSSLRLHPILLRLVPLLHHLSRQEVRWLHSNHVVWSYCLVEELIAHVRVLDQDRHHRSELVLARLLLPLS